MKSRKRNIKTRDIKSKDILIPEFLRDDIDRAIKILKEEGCSEIFLFGSAVTGKHREKSDIDLAIQGCPQGRFFHLLGRLLWELGRPVDLVNLDTQDPFAQCLRREGVLVRVG